MTQITIYSWWKYVAVHSPVVFCTDPNLQDHLSQIYVTCHKWQSLQKSTDLIIQLINNGYFAWQKLIIQLPLEEVHTHIDWQSSLCTIHRSSNAPDCHQVNACNVLTLVPPVNTLLCYVASIGANWAPPNISPHGGLLWRGGGGSISGSVSGGR